MQYSINAIPHDTRMAFHSGQSWPYFRCPYQAKVMKTLDRVSSSMVLIAGAPRKAGQAQLRPGGPQRAATAARQGSSVAGMFLGETAGSRACSDSAGRSSIAPY